MTQQNQPAQASRFSELVSGHMPTLPAETIQKWMRNPEALQCALESALSCPPETHECLVPSIKVTIGTDQDANALKAALIRERFYIGDWARKLLATLTFATSPEKSEVGLVIRSVADLGFQDGAPYKDICAKAHEMGLALCPIEVALQLRLQYLNQPKEEWFIVATESVKSSRYPSLFYVGHGNDGLALSADYGYPDTFFNRGHRFAFVVPQTGAPQTGA